MSEFDFYTAQDTLAKLRADEERWAGKLLIASRRFDALRTRRKRMEIKIEKEKIRLAPKTCGAVRPTTSEDVRAGVEPKPCPLAVGHQDQHRDGSTLWRGL